MILLKSNHCGNILTCLAAYSLLFHRFPLPLRSSSSFFSSISIPMHMMICLCAKLSGKLSLSKHSSFHYDMASSDEERERERNKEPRKEILESCIMWHTIQKHTQRVLLSFMRFTTNIVIKIENSSYLTRCYRMLDSQNSWSHLIGLPCIIYVSGAYTYLVERCSFKM